SKCSKRCAPETARSDDKAPARYQPMNDGRSSTTSPGFPFLDHIGLVVREHEPGSSTCSLTVAPFHFNSSGLVHGAVIFALADTGMGAALMGTLEAGETCATVEL